MKKLILIDGGPAAGKNTLGELLVQKLSASGDKAILLDLDTYVEQLNPTWIWDDEERKQQDQLTARMNVATDIDNYLQQEYTVLVIGERLLTKADVSRFVSRLKTSVPIFLYHLSVPFSLREARLHARGPHTLIDLARDQKDRDAIESWPGYVYENVNSVEVDAENLLSLINDEVGEQKD